MDIQHCIQIQRSLGTLIIVSYSILFLANATFISQKDVLQNIRSDVIGCLPCSQRFVADSYFEKHGGLVDSGLEDLLSEEFLLHESCQLPQSTMNELHGLSISGRHLEGDGSHRHLVTFINVDINSARFMPHMEICELVVIERLPTGVFADSFEVQHLVQRGAFLDAAVFGDTNLELPSALSNRSVVEIHKDIWHEISSKHMNRLEFTPLDSSGYSRVLIGQPDLMMRCKQKMHGRTDCLSLLIRVDTGYVNHMVWQIPCGVEELTGIVSIVTFASALVSSLLIVFFASSYSSSQKGTKKE